MSGKRRASARPSHEDTKAIRRAVAYLGKIGRLDPLQEAVGGDIADMLDEALRTGAMMRVRIANMGTGVKMPMIREQEGMWTPDEDRTLERLRYREMRPWAFVAERLGRTVSSCQNRAERLGYSTNQEWAEWTKAEDDQLRAFVAAKVTVKRVAAEMDRTVEAIRHRARTLGLSFDYSDTRRLHKTWSQPELDRLTELWHEGKRMREIAEVLDRTPGGVEQQVKRLGLQGTRKVPEPQYRGTANDDGSDFRRRLIERRKSTMARHEAERARLRAERERLMEETAI